MMVYGLLYLAWRTVDFFPCIVYSDTVRGVKNPGARLCFAWKAGCNRIPLQTQTPLGYYSDTQCCCLVIGLRWESVCFLWSLSSFCPALVCIDLWHPGNMDTDHSDKTGFIRKGIEKCTDCIKKNIFVICYINITRLKWRKSDFPP